MRTMDEALLRFIAVLRMHRRGVRRRLSRVDLPRRRNSTKLVPRQLATTLRAQSTTQRLLNTRVTTAAVLPLELTHFTDPFKSVLASLTTEFRRLWVLSTHTSCATKQTLRSPSITLATVAPTLLRTLERAPPSTDAPGTLVLVPKCSTANLVPRARLSSPPLALHPPLRALRTSSLLFGPFLSLSSLSFWLTRVCTSLFFFGMAILFWTSPHATSLV